MREYDETTLKIANRIFEQGDAILEQRKKKAIKIKQTSYAISGLCAAAIVSVGIWEMANLKKLPDNHFSELETIEDEITTNSQTIITLTTTPSSITELSTQTTASKSQNPVIFSIKTTITENKTSEILQTTMETNASVSENIVTTIKTSTVNLTTKPIETTSIITKATTQTTVPVYIISNPTTQSTISTYITDIQTNPENTVTTSEPLNNNTNYNYDIRSTADMDVDELIEKIGDFSPITGYILGYAGEYSGETISSFNFKHDFLSEEDNTLYVTDMVIYRVINEGKKAFAVSFPQSDKLYLYNIIKTSELSKSKYTDNNGIVHEVTRISTYDMDVEQMIEMMGAINIANDNKFTCKGLYQNDITEDIKSFANGDNHYIPEDEIMYVTPMTVYCVRDTNGEKAYAVKFRQSDNLYLYTLAEQGTSEMFWISDSEPDINVDDLLSNDEELPDIGSPVVTTNDLVRIENETIATTAIVVTTENTTPIVTYPVSSSINGDANCDNELSMADAVLIMQSIANPAKFGSEGTDINHITEQGKKNADITGKNDGVTNADALAVQKMLLNLD